MSLTLRDVAQRAKVSSSTVSRVLNNYPYVGEETRTVVLQAAEELGYPIENLRRAPPPAAHTILLLTRFPQEKSQPEMLAGIERAIALGAQSVFEPLGITTRVQHLRTTATEVQLYTNDATIAGLILLGGVVNRDFIANLQRLQVPFVVAGSHVQPLQVNCVMADYQTGIEQAVTHLIQQGRRAIGLVNGLPTTTSSAEKFNGYRLALALHDLPYCANRVVASDFTAEAGYQQTRQLLQQAPDLDAVVYGDDNMAMGGLHALKEQGYEVPQDVAITGFYNYEIGRFTDPPLTSVSFDMQGMGIIAAQRLQMLVEEQDKRAWSVVLPTQLVIRSSS
ncbi:MAG: LacI family DNA-binding transcriptional regulator [Caldilineaceae bacterium]